MVYSLKSLVCVEIICPRILNSRHLFISYLMHALPVSWKQVTTVTSSVSSLAGLWAGAARVSVSRLTLPLAPGRRRRGGPAPAGEKARPERSQTARKRSHHL